MKTNEALVFKDGVLIGTTPVKDFDRLSSESEVSYSFNNSDVFTTSEQYELEYYLKRKGKFYFRNKVTGLRISFEPTKKRDIEFFNSLNKGDTGTIK